MKDVEFCSVNKINLVHLFSPDFYHVFLCLVPLRTMWDYFYLFIAVFINLVILGLNSELIRAGQLFCH